MAEDKPKLPGDVVSGFDQFGVMLENSGKLMGDYFRSLIENGVPEWLAGELVKELHRLYFSKLGNAPNEK